MTFHDLPDDWALRPLGDPDLTADIVDLCVSDKDRMAGGLAWLLCRRDRTLGQPVFVGEIPDEEGMLMAVGSLGQSMLHLPDFTGVVVGIARHWGAVTDADRRVHQRAIEVCRSIGVDLLGTYVVTTGEVVHLPIAPDLAREHGAA